MTTRRDFLFALGASALVPSLASATGCGVPRDETDSTDSTGALPLAGVGVQLYMLRAQMKADPEGTLARIAELGYNEIEWWGSWGRTPAQLRAVLDANKLTSPAAHIDPKDLAKENLPALLDTAATMGHKSVLVAWTPPDQRRSADDWKRVAETLNVAGASAAAAGVRTGYHNHDFEFERFGSRSGFEILLEETDANLVDIELDCFWAFKAGFEPLALLNAHKDRIKFLHLKDSSARPEHAQRDIGAGVIQWKPILATGLANRVTNVFVEQDDPADPWASAAAGRAYLRTLGY
jgi:sugar phosphate isomerase/epimerase